MALPFQKGNDPRRHMKGRGKGVVSIPDLLRRIGKRKLPPKLAERLTSLRQMPPENIKTSRTMLESLMEVVYWCALNGESWAVEFVANRTEGRVKDVISFEPTDGAVDKARQLLAKL